MKRIQKITALFCALALAVSSFGTYTDNARAAELPVTSDDAFLSRETTQRGTTKNTGAKTNVQKLEFGKKVQGRLVSRDDGQQYQITLKSSGQLDIHLEGAAGKLATCLTDQNGKGWAPRRKTTDGKQTYQLKKGTYYYQVQIEKGLQIPETGLDYTITATFKSAKARYEDNNTRKKAAKAPWYLCIIRQGNLCAVGRIRIGESMMGTGYGIGKSLAERLDWLRFCRQARII